MVPRQCQRAASTRTAIGSPYRYRSDDFEASHPDAPLSWHTRGVGTAIEEVEADDAEVDVISLTIPSAVRFVRLARIGVASLARRKGMSVRSIDDLRLAIDETFSLLLGGVDHPGSMDVTFEVDAHELSVIVVQLSLIHISEPTRPY